LREVCSVFSIEKKRSIAAVFTVAFFYSSVGHGGATGYLAALALQTGMTVEQLAQAPLSSRTWGAALQHAAAGFAALPTAAVEG